MKLEHLKATACPECGAEIKSLGRTRKKPRGPWHERISFECEYGLSYSPITNCTVVEEDCSNSGRAAAWMEQRKAIAKAMVGAVKAHVGKPGLELPSLERSLRSDINLYRDDLEKVTP